MAYIHEVDFGNEAGEDATLAETAMYFVEQDDFANFLNMRNRLLIARAKKGVGKSALLEWLYLRNKDIEDTIVVKVRGSDLSNFNLEKLSSSDKPNDRIYNWMSRMAAVVNREIGRVIKFAFEDDEISLVQASELDGFKERNLVSALLERFSKPVEKLGVKDEKIRISNELEILARSKRGVLLLIDDVDATFQNTNEEKLELSTLFSACRSLVTKVEGLSIRITIRADVWPIVRKYDESLDKVEQYIKDIQWSEQDFKKILAKRVRFSIQSGDSERDNWVLDKVFVNDAVWDGKPQPLHRPIYTLSYRRPRWGIQLAKLGQKNALHDRKTRIDLESIENSLVNYGLKRIDDIVVEHQHQCKNINEIILAFRGAPRRFKYQELIDWIVRKIANHISVVIDQADTRDPVTIAAFLYRIGFILARVNRDSEYQHLGYDEFPDFFSRQVNAGASDVEWEIHPCYRQALDIQKVGEAKARSRSSRL